MTIDREALLAKATWFYRCPNTGEYSGEYCTVRPHDDSNMVPMISVDAVLSALDQPAPPSHRRKPAMTIDREALREKVAAREMARCYSERAWKSDPSFMARKGEDDPNEPRWFAPDEYAEAMWRLYLEDAKAVVASLSALDQPAQEPVAEGTRQVERVVFGRETGEVFATGYHRVTPQPAQEPVAWMVNGRAEQGLTFDREAADNMAQANGGEVVPLYTAPQPATLHDESR